MDVDHRIEAGEEVSQEFETLIVDQFAESHLRRGAEVTGVGIGDGFII